MKIEVGKVYLKRDNFLPTVKKVLQIEGDYVIYKALYGSGQFMRNPQNKVRKQKLQTFKKRLLGEIPEEDDPEMYRQKYAGSILWKNYTVLTMSGEPMMKCYERKARHWIKKGYAVRVDEDTIQFTVSFIEDKLRKYYGNNMQDNPFWMAERNKNCVVCGATSVLTSHHVVPERHLKKVPLEIRKNLSNRLFICSDCHNAYEAVFFPKDRLTKEPVEPDFDLSDPYSWERHFIETMKPKHMPEGWNIIIEGKFIDVS